jgi:GNAT superfamily N-acetyltransferase
MGLLTQEFHTYFTPQIIIKTQELCKQYRQNHLVDVKVPELHTVFLAVCFKDKPVAIFKGYATTSHNFLMDITVVHPEYRRQGIYTALLDAIISYTQVLGFSSITSTHSPSNNPIILAKLKKGFFITNMLITLPFGPEVELIYFHNESLKTAFLFRCGDLKLNPALVQNSKGSLAKLHGIIEQGLAVRE